MSHRVALSTPPSSNSNRERGPRLSATDPHQGAYTLVSDREPVNRESVNVLVSDRTPLISSDEELPAISLPDSKEKPLFVPSLTQRLSEVVQSMIFQTIMALAIIANALVIGLETDYADYPNWGLIEGVFLALFAMELAARMVSVGLWKFFSFWNEDFIWNTFDFVIVVFGILDALAEMVSPKLSDGGGEATLFRMVRLFRIVRIFKIIRFLKQLYLLAHGFIEAAQSVFWVTFLMVFVHYVCSIVLVRTIGHLPESDDDEHQKFLHEQYGTILKAMLSLFDLMSQPDMHPYHGMRGAYPLFTVFLMCWIIFGSFGMIALLTGVISESMFEKNGLRIDAERMEREQKRNGLNMKLGDVYERIAKENAEENGDVSVIEVLRVLPEVEKIFEEVQVAYTKHDMQHIVSIMDADESGSISKEEFVHGLVSIAEEIRPMSIAELFHSVSLVKSRIAKCQGQIGLSNAIQEHTCKRLQDLTAKIEEVANFQNQGAADSGQILETVQSLASGLSQQQVLGVPAVDSRDSGLAAKISICEQGIIETRDIVSDLQNQLKVNVSEQAIRETRDMVSDLQSQLKKLAAPMHGSQEAPLKEEGISANERAGRREIFQAAVSEMEAKVIILKSAYKDAEQELKNLEIIRSQEGSGVSSGPSGRENVRSQEASVASSGPSEITSRDIAEGRLELSEQQVLSNANPANHTGPANELQERSASGKEKTPPRGGSFAHEA